MQLFLVTMAEMTYLLIAAENEDAVKKVVMNTLFWPVAISVVSQPEMTCRLLGAAKPGTECGVILRADCIRASVREEKTPAVEVVCQG